MTETKQMTGLLQRGVGGLYEACSDQDGKVYILRARGIFRRQGRTPLVGDRVCFTPGRGEEHGWLEDILPRKNQIRRPPVANIDALYIVIAPEPTADLLLADRLLVWARQAGIRPFIVVNKCDLVPGLYDEIQEQYRASETPVYRISAQTGEGIDAFRKRLNHQVSCFAGQSAVGKSSLVNALFSLDLQVGAVSGRTERGRHTTRQVQLIRKGDAILLDTPGFSLLDLQADMPPEDLALYYPEYMQRARDCKFSPCTHDREPGCAVRNAVEQGDINEKRYARYLTLLEQVKEAWRGRYG